MRFVKLKTAHGDGTEVYVNVDGIAMLETWTNSLTGETANWVSMLVPETAFDAETTNAGFAGVQVRESPDEILALIRESKVL